MKLLDWINTEKEFGNQLLKEWTGLDEMGYAIDINSISHSSNIKIHWKCDKYKGYEWDATLNNRTSKLQKCPYCSGKKCVSGVNDLYTWCIQNKDIGSTIIEEWTGIDENDNIVDIHNILKKSNKVVKWQCRNNNEHIWNAPIGRRVVNNSGCPYCKYENDRIKKIKEAVLNGESLDIWCKNNGYWGENIRNEWTGQSLDGKTFKINEISPKSNQNMIWRCKNNHIWHAVIYDRTINKQGCRQCSNIGTSKQELFLYYSIKQIFPKTIHRGKYNGYEFDITIPEIKMCIEYGSLIWHKDKRERDLAKRNICIKNKVRFIEIIDITGYTEQNTYENSEYTIYYEADYKSVYDTKLAEILDSLLKQYNHSFNEVDINDVLYRVIHHKYNKK